MLLCYSYRRQNQKQCSKMIWFKRNCYISINARQSNWAITKNLINERLMFFVAFFFFTETSFRSRSRAAHNYIETSLRNGSPSVPPTTVIHPSGGCKVTNGFYISRLQAALTADSWRFVGLFLFQVKEKLQILVKSFEIAIFIQLWTFVVLYR